jgi:hypothetical protein
MPPRIMLTLEKFLTAKGTFLTYLEKGFDWIMFCGLVVQGDWNQL